MGKIVKLTESQLIDIIKKTIVEQQTQDWKTCIENSIKKMGVKYEKKDYLRFVQYIFSYEVFKKEVNLPDKWERDPTKGQGVYPKPGGTKKVMETKKITWSFESNNTWYENNYIRKGTYECKNDELILHDTKNLQKYSTSKGKKWIGEKENFESIKPTTKTAEQPAKPSTPANPSTSKIPQGKKELFPMRRGMRGNYTMELQKKLGVVGYGNKPTGYFGNLTQAAVTKAMSKLGKKYDPNVGLSQADYNQIMGNQQQPVDNEPWLGQFKTQ